MLLKENYQTYFNAVVFDKIAHLISIWPCSYLKLSDLISKEIINSDSLTKPVLFSNNTNNNAPGGPTVLDYVLLGVLITKTWCSKLKTIDFTGFHRDLKLTKEICHLALLWLKPQNRTLENIYQKIQSRCCKCFVNSLLLLLLL